MDGGVTSPNRLFRGRNDRMIAGVAGGLGQYFNVDPVLVRLGFVLLGLGTGIGVVAYIVMAIIVPERPVGEEEPTITSSIGSLRGRETAGYILLGLGALLLASNLGLFRLLVGNRLWPAVLIGAGVLLLLNRART